MKFKIDNHQIEETQRLAITNIASTLSIRDTLTIHTTSTEVLVSEIKKDNSSLVKPLLEYLESYQNWAYYHMEHNDDQQLSDIVKTKLQELLTNRNNTRNKLASANAQYKKSRK